MTLWLKIELSITSILQMIANNTSKIEQLILFEILYVSCRLYVETRCM